MMGLLAFSEASRMELKDVAEREEGPRSMLERHSRRRSDIVGFKVSAITESASSSQASKLVADSRL